MLGDIKSWTCGPGGKNHVVGQLKEWRSRGKAMDLASVIEEKSQTEREYQWERYEGMRGEDDDIPLSTQNIARCVGLRVP